MTLSPLGAPRTPAPRPTDRFIRPGAYQALEQLLERTDVVAAVNQVEVHPYFQQREVQDLGREIPEA